MNIEWHGQSAFTLRGSERSVLIDPFDQRLRPEGMSIRFDYPQIPQQQVDLLLITHEHFDHNGRDIADGSPHLVRSTAGSFEGTPVGEVIAIASEHDDHAGTRRGPNTIFVFALDGIRICHMGDFGQAALRPQQREAIGTVDLLFVPVGGGPTIGAEGASEITRALDPRWVVPMHYRTDLIDFLEPAGAFLAAFDDVHRPSAGEFDLSGVPAGEGPRVVQPGLATVPA
jgi:L-ascorbate metabolism protein UlaG (beta-lactamase superfamily)